MRGAGFDVTQATLSRDIRELGLVKGGPDGAYQAPPRAETNGQTPAVGVAARARRRSCAASIACSSWCCCAPGSGMRSRSCALLDGARLPEVVGTLAGEDTILVITPDARRARALVKRLEEMSNP